MNLHDSLTRKHASGYRIRGLFHQSLRQSALYLDRNRALRVIEHILHKEKNTPVTQRNPEWILREYLVLYAHHGSQCSKEESRTKALDILIRNSKWLFDVIQKKSRQGGFLDKNSWKRFVDVANRNASELQHMLGASTESVQDEEEEAMDVDSDRDDFDEGLNLTVRDRVELGIENVNDILTKLKKKISLNQRTLRKGGRFRRNSVASKDRICQLFSIGALLSRPVVRGYALV